MDRTCLQQLTAALVQEQESLFAHRRNAGPIEGLRALVDRKSIPGTVATYRESRTRANGFFASPTGTTLETAEVELNALRRQFAVLWTLAGEWQSGSEEGGSRTVKRAPASGRPRQYYTAIGALTGFYIGDEARPDDKLIAETQLAWISAQSRSGLQFSKAERRVRAVAWGRYRELWRSWARSIPLDEERQ